jgi:Domain of unknown function (DUF5915)
MKSALLVGICQFQVVRSAMLQLFIVCFQILVLLDISPDESMLDEGLAREVINRIQKLRKKVLFSLLLCQHSRLHLHHLM